MNLTEFDLNFGRKFLDYRILPVAILSHTNISINNNEKLIRKMCDIKYEINLSNCNLNWNLY